MTTSPTPAAGEVRPEPRSHSLKVWPEFFAALADGSKTFEVRKDDRGYAVGDRLWLNEWQPYPDGGGGEYTSGQLAKDITYILRGPAFGIEAGHVVMGLADPPPDVFCTELARDDLAALSAENARLQAENAELRRGGSADQPRDVLLGKSLRQRAHELRILACGTWSGVVKPPYEGLDEAQCDLAAAHENRLRCIIDELADLSSAAESRAKEMEAALSDADWLVDKVAYYRDNRAPVWQDIARMYVEKRDALRSQPKDAGAGGL